MDGDLWDAERSDTVRDARGSFDITKDGTLGGLPPGTCWPVLLTATDAPVIVRNVRTTRCAIALPQPVASRGPSPARPLPPSTTCRSVGQTAMHLDCWLAPARNLYATPCRNGALLVGHRADSAVREG